MSPPRRTKLDILKSLPPRTLIQAKRKIMDLLSKRDHSEFEIREKLKRRTETDVMNQALAWAHENNWIPAEEKMQNQVVQSMGLRKKGQNAINLKLKKMGLKPVKSDPEIEFENCLRALETKYKRDILENLKFLEFQKQKAKITRFLLGKGFNHSTIQNATKNFFSLK